MGCLLLVVIVKCRGAAVERLAALPITTLSGVARLRIGRNIDALLDQLELQIGGPESRWRLLLAKCARPQTIQVVGDAVAALHLYL